MKNNIKKIAVTLLLVFGVALVFQACGSSKKCNGKKGIRTDMGTM